MQAIYSFTMQAVLYSFENFVISLWQYFDAVFELSYLIIDLLITNGANITEA